MSNAYQLAALGEIDQIRDQVLENKLWQDGENLSRIVVKLTAYNAYLSELVAEAEADMHAAEAHYKFTFDSLLLEISQENSKADKADRMTVDVIKAKVGLATQKELELWNSAKKNFKILSLKRVDTNNLADAMRSRLSFMKSERVQV